MREKWNQAYTIIKTTTMKAANSFLYLLGFNTVSEDLTRIYIDIYAIPQAATKTFSSP